MRAYLGMLKAAARSEVPPPILSATAQVTRFPAICRGCSFPTIPSQQNTFTGKLTQAMLARVLGEIRRFLEKDSST